MSDRDLCGDHPDSDVGDQMDVPALRALHDRCELRDRCEVPDRHDLRDQSHEGDRRGRLGGHRADHGRRRVDVHLLLRAVLRAGREQPLPRAFALAPSRERGAQLQPAR